MKKFLFALMGFVVALPVWAGCGCISDWGDRVKISHIVVTFDTGKYDVCDCAKSEVENFLNKLSDIKEVEIIGSADSQGEDANNKTLAGNRLNAVREILPTTYSYKEWNEGESGAYYDKAVGAQQMYRSVTIIPHQKHVSEICEEDAVEKYINENQDSDLAKGCKEGLGNEKIIDIVTRIPELDDVASIYEIIAELDEYYINVLNGKRSVWKDKEGNFNTARLISDSVAGVVLGTVGGVVTSTVIKKNQVEDGFEDLRCAIGGQNVAHWGDEFVVGIVK